MAAPSSIYGSDNRSSSSSSVSENGSDDGISRMRLEGKPVVRCGLYEGPASQRPRHACLHRPGSVGEAGEKNSQMAGIGMHRAEAAPVWLLRVMGDRMGQEGRELLSSLDGEERHPSTYALGPNASA